jgi:hypothetical protein
VTGSLDTQTKTTIMSNLSGKTTIVVGGPRRGRVC